MSAQVITKEKIVTRPTAKGPAPIPHCAGCHYGIIQRIICECIDELGIQGSTVIVAGVGCTTSWGRLQFATDATATPHGRPPNVGMAIKRLHPDCTVITVQGDGDLAAIGMGVFINALQRWEKLTTVFLNNAGYGMTGGQMAPTTLLEQVTTTTPYGRDPNSEGFPIHVAELAAMFKGCAYSARVSLHTPANRTRAKRALKTAIEKQIKGIGYGLVEFLSACPSSWRLTPQECITFIDEKMLAEYPLEVFKDVDKIE